MFLMQKESMDKMREIKDRWLSCDTFLKMQGKIQALQSRQTGTAEHIARGSLPSGRSTGFCKQLGMLLAREVRGTLRNKGILYARFGMALFLAALYGWLFSGSAAQGDKKDSSEPNCVAGNFDAGGCTGDFQAHFGTLVSLSIMAMMGAAQPVILQFPQERPVFLSLAVLHQQDASGDARGIDVPDSHLYSHVFLDGPEGQCSADGGSVVAPGHRLIIPGPLSWMWGSFSTEGHSVGTAHTDPTDAVLRPVCSSGKNPIEPQMGPLPLSIEICN